MYFNSRPKWHEGDDWAKVLKLYDEIAEQQFGQIEDHESRNIPTSFGDTHVHLFGPANRQPVIFFHGINANSLMFGDWLIPALCSKFRIIAVDTVGDIGRSRPRDGDPTNCPQTEKQIAEWAKQVLDGLSINRKVRVVGYSLGAYIGMCLAKHLPDKVSKVVTVAPAGVFGSVQLQWIARVIGFSLMLKMVPTDSTYAETLRLWIIGSMMGDPSLAHTTPRQEFRKATESVGPSQVGFRPTAFEIEILSKMNKVTPILLLIGAQETVLNPETAISNAREAGIKFQTFQKAGHLLCYEPIRNQVIQEIDTFLSS